MSIKSGDHDADVHCSMDAQVRSTVGSFWARMRAASGSMMNTL
jgi:hypothetical protein